MSLSNHFDLIIIGGGLAGATLACALKNTSLTVAVVEAFELKTNLQPSYDDRTVALSFGSRCIFEKLGLWPALEIHVETINTIHISDRGHFGVTRLTNEQEGVAALGYVIENKKLGESLYDEMENADNITLFCPAELTAIQQDERQVTVKLLLNANQHTSQPKAQPESQHESPLELSAKLLVAADGNNSQVMQLLNIGSSRKNYDQVALITNITPGKKHDNIAYERFTDTGPLAFLPMQKNRCSVVWTLRPGQADTLLELNDVDFLDQLQQRFGFRLGQLKKVGSRQVYPLFLQSASQMEHGRTAIIGNAAHSVHPVAGQGFNLALRDIALLSELIVDTSGAEDDIGNPVLLQQYASQRDQDTKQVYRFTDALVTTFSNAITPLAHLRSLSLFLVDILPDIKHQLANQSMGLNKGRAGVKKSLSRGLRL